MPIIKPRKLTSRGILAPLLPAYFRRPKHPQQMLPEDSRSINVPWDADELFDRIKFNRKKFRAKVMAAYDDAIKTHHRPKDSTWSPMTGCFVPRPQMIATQLFPLALGSNIMRFINKNLAEMWSPVNGLMLPKPAEEAWRDLALTIVPGSPLEILDSRQSQRNSAYKFCVMDRKHPAISRSLYQHMPRYDLPQVTIEQIDNKELIFGNDNRPKIVFFYFQSCCAVWKKTYLDNPDCDDEADFAARFLNEMSQYWHPEIIKKSKVTDIFTFKCKTVSFDPKAPVAPGTREVEPRPETLPDWAASL